MSKNGKNDSHRNLPPSYHPTTYPRSRAYLRMNSPQRFRTLNIDGSTIRLQIVRAHDTLAPNGITCCTSPPWHRMPHLTFISLYGPPHLTSLSSHAAPTCTTRDRVMRDVATFVPLPTPKVGHRRTRTLSYDHFRVLSRRRWHPCGASCTSL